MKFVFVLFVYLYLVCGSVVLFASGLVMFGLHLVWLLFFGRRCFAC